MCSISHYDTTASCLFSNVKLHWILLIFISEKHNSLIIFAFQSGVLEVKLIKTE